LVQNVSFKDCCIAIYVFALLLMPLQICFLWVPIYAFVAILLQRFSFIIATAVMLSRIYKVKAKFEIL